MSHCNLVKRNCPLPACRNVPERCTKSFVPRPSAIGICWVRLTNGRFRQLKSDLGPPPPPSAETRVPKLRPVPAAVPVQLRGDTYLDELLSRSSIVPNRHGPRRIRPSAPSVIWRPSCHVGTNRFHMSFHSKTAFPPLNRVRCSAVETARNQSLLHFFQNAGQSMVQRGKKRKRSGIADGNVSLEGTAPG